MNKFTYNVLHVTCLEITQSSLTEMHVYSSHGVPNKGIYTAPKWPKLDLTTNVEYVANLVISISGCKRPCNGAVYYINMLYLHNDIFTSAKEDM